MRVSFRNCREIWKQVPEIVEKGVFFQFVESRIKLWLLIGWAGKKMICLWMAFPWPLDGTMRWNYLWSCILLCCFCFFTKELCIIIKIKVRECSFKNQFTACHYKPGLVCFLPHFSLRVQLFFKRKKLQFFLTDLCLSNGTYIDGKKILPNSRRLITNGQKINFGNCVCAKVKILSPKNKKVLGK